MPAAKSSRRLLLLDDDRQRGRALKTRLTALGFHCYWAQALDEAEQVTELLDLETVLIQPHSDPDVAWTEAVGRLCRAASEARALVFGVDAAESDQLAQIDCPHPPELLLSHYDTFDDFFAAVERALGDRDRRSTAEVLASSASEVDPELLPVVELQPVKVEATSSWDAWQESEEGEVTDRGDLSTTSARELLWRLHDQKASGELRVDLPEGTLQVFLEGGQPAAAEGGGFENALGRVMERHKLLTRRPTRRPSATCRRARPVSGSARFCCGREARPRSPSRRDWRCRPRPRSCSSSELPWERTPSSRGTRPRGHATPPR